MTVKLHRTLEAPQGPMSLEVDFEIPPGQLITLYGESGAGKTSVLRMLSGLMLPDYGCITFDQDIWFDSEKKINKRPQERNIGYVFQDYALFPNMTVDEQIRFSLKNKSEKNIISELIDVLELGNLRHRTPVMLSGGQQQRVALARVLACKPHLLLLDEPLSALGFNMRQRLQDYIISIQHKYKLTTILVSHDVGEVYRLSQSVIWLEDGKIKDQGDPKSVFSHKQTSGNFQLLGEVLRIEKADVIYITTVLIGNSLVKVVTEESEAIKLKAGDKVLVASKAFYPIIQQVE